MSCLKTRTCLGLGLGLGFGLDELPEDAHLPVCRRSVCGACAAQELNANFFYAATVLLGAGQLLYIYEVTAAAVQVGEGKHQATRLAWSLSQRARRRGERGGGPTPQLYGGGQGQTSAEEPVRAPSGGPLRAMAVLR